MNIQTRSYEVKNGKAFPPIKRYAWLLALVIGVAGMFYPLLGLPVPFIMAALMGMSLFKGKYWCGNICPHGSFFDNLLQPVSRRMRVPEILRSKTVVAAVLLVFMVSMALRFVRLFGAMDPGAFYERLGLIFASTYLMVLLIGGLLAVTISPRAWCFFCPMGTLQGVLYKLGKALGLTKHSDEKVALTQPDHCRSCGKCSRACAVQLEPYKNLSENGQFEDERCIRCRACTEKCPAGILHLVKPEERG